MNTNLPLFLNFIYSNPYTLFILATWSLIWKGLALYKAARKEAKIWFVILLIVNTVGILEILYFFFLYKIDFSRLLANLKKGKIK